MVGSTCLDQLRPLLSPKETSLAVATAILHVALLSPVPWPTNLCDSVVLAAQAEVPYAARKRPGEDSWQRALSQALLRIDSNTWLPELLEARPNNRAVTLSFLQNGGEALGNGCLALLASCALDFENDIANAVNALQVLAAQPQRQLESLRPGFLDRVREGDSIPLFQEALLPLAARLEPHAVQTLAKIEELAVSESTSARMSACQALSAVLADAGKSVEAHAFRAGRLLLDFLQDEDMDIRTLAADTFSRAYCERQPVQASRAVDLLWNAIIKRATVSETFEAADAMLSRAEAALQDMEDQTGLLFAVEKSNVYVDGSVDISAVGRLIQKYRDEVVAHAGWTGIAERLRRLRQTLSDCSVKLDEEGGIENALTAEAEAIVSMLETLVS